MGTLFLVATPIGNLGDVTLRALDVLREVPLIAAEDTRHTRKLLERYEISTPLISYNEHNKGNRQSELLARLGEGDLALVSDAGTPALSDPGYELVNAAIEAGHDVSPIPGPSAPIAALVASGLPTDSFVFLGYLPRKAADRKRALREAAAQGRTIIAFEAPHRLLTALDDIREELGAGRGMVACRELTKVHEEILRGTAGELREHFAEREPRGEFTLVIDYTDPMWDEGEVREAVRRHIADGMRRSQAAQKVAAEAGWPRRAVYELAEGSE